LLAEATTTEPNRHAESLLPLTERLLSRTGLAKRDFCAIVAGTGPGSFTGLRVGLALATGMGLGLGVPVVGVSSLLLLAAALQRRLAPNSSGKAVALGAVLDARRGESFFAAFDENLESLVAPCLLPNAALAAFIQAELDGFHVVVAGATASSLLDPRLLPSDELRGVDALAFPSAHEAALLVRSKHVSHDPLPFYLREADAKLPALPRNPLTSVD
jgi:tRNA threonylcarbamoyl adenosine modification protein YeaZ